MWSFCYREINSDPAPIQLHPIGALLSFLGIIYALKINKGKSSGAPRLLVIHDSHVGNGPVLRKNFSEISLCGVQAQTKYSKTAVGVRVCLVPNVAPTSGHGRMAVAMPSAIIATVRPATGASMGPGPGPRPRVTLARASSGSRPRFGSGPGLGSGTPGIFLGVRPCRAMPCGIPRSVSASTSGSRAGFLLAVVLLAAVAHDAGCCRRLLALR